MIVKVFTKYDNIPERIIVPYVRKLRRQKLDPTTIILPQEYAIAEKHLLLKRAIQGLEGVKFVHYGRKYEHGLD